MLRGS